MERNFSNAAAAGPALADTPELRLAVHSAAEWTRLARVWAELHRGSGSRSFFLTEEWTGTWLETFGRDVPVSILVFESREGPAGICLLAQSTRHPLLRIRRVSLNASGEAAEESTYIEYNNVLCRPGWETAAARALAAHVLSLDWDEFALDGIEDGAVYRGIRRELSGIACEERVQPCYYVDLAALRHDGIRFEATLRSRYRNNLHRSMREHAKLGPLRLERAADPARALEMFEELAEFSRRRGAMQGRWSTFAAPRFLDFHRRLIARCFASGSIDLLRLSAGARIIGALYNLIQGGKVHAYQCGCWYPGGQWLGPGNVTNAQGIQYYLDSGQDEWDFLAGDTASKRSFTDSSRNLFWAVFRRPNTRTRLLRAGRALRRWWRREPAASRKDK